jgi:hypothetical protein
MDVYLVPVGAGRHELYCEVADAAPAPDAPDGLRRRLLHRFREILATAEREHRERGAALSSSSSSSSSSALSSSWTRRLRDRAMRWIAETVAEQRLLWHLRGCREARLQYPDDMAEAAAIAALRAQLASDYERHRWWFGIDALGFVASGAFILVPGPNVLAYYFFFRFVGHYLSMRGARQGLDVTTWRAEPSRALAELRRALALPAPERQARLHELGRSLHLQHLAHFVERTATT